MQWRCYAFATWGMGEGPDSKDSLWWDTTSALQWRSLSHFCTLQCGRDSEWARSVARRFTYTANPKGPKDHSYICQVGNSGSYRLIPHIIWRFMVWFLGDERPEHLWGLRSNFFSANLLRSIFFREGPFSLGFLHFSEYHPQRRCSGVLYI